MKATLFILAAVCAVLVAAQMPIPRSLGFSQGNVNAIVHLEIHADLLCPDCKAAWPVVKQVVAHYGDKLFFTFHTFPLPYHHHAFYAAQGAYIVAQNNPSQIFNYIDALFDNQDAFENGPTAAMTANQVVSNFAALGSKTTGINAASFLASFNATTDWPTRVEWKFGCSRGVLGTPTFFLNGANLAADASWTLAQWQQVIDPILVQAPFTTYIVPMAVSTGSLTTVQACPAGQPVCEYLPGKIECCLAGEGCIPNVGCRC